ncbi:glycoside hydrolase family 61 protein [Tulasnella calospora MUT 4182]|uniref:AA9 family lytic polysaccharide monooxygenase n=1 Tax=Tulasnella calospora MUT 4182 TaxID=1051891 RepID=A0A0C3Q680_9AGAM|nr:glycoside hydrolase family 61 protein [Tulasnella calospora MUT 4182]
MYTSSLAVLALSVASAQAHSIFQRVHVNGVDQGLVKGIRYPDYNGPITDVDSVDIICNGGVNPLHTPLPTDIINIPAGATVGAEWHHGLNAASAVDPSDPSDPIDSSHKGPIMAYLAKVDSALTTTVTGLQWFKIWEDGLHSDGTWAVDTMIANKGIVNFTIPTCIPPGNYLLRVELIALHGASVYPGAQFYMECAQINVTGGGTASPATVSFPGAYHGTDPGVTINIYYPAVTNYTIPGPRPFTCGGSSTSTTTKTSSTTSKTSATTTTTTTSKTTTTTTTSSSKTTTTTTTASTSASTGTAAHYAQCGGEGIASRLSFLRRRS